MNKSKGTTPEALEMKAEVISTDTKIGLGDSFRVLYYGKASSSVPFMWESQPGTPKHAALIIQSSLIPPLTPPPSYYNQNYYNSSSNKSRGFIRKIFLDHHHRNSSSRKTSSSFSSSSVSSSSSSSMYMHSAPTTPMRWKMSPVKFGSEDDCGGAGGSPMSTLCRGDHGIKKHYLRMKKFKKAMLSFVPYAKALLQ